MSSSTPHGRLGATFGSLIFLGALFFSLFLSSGAHAIGTVCRTDPVVTLSNGTVINLEAVINADASAVRSITYNVRIPRGTSVSAVQYDGVIPASAEHLTFVADRDSGHYQAVTTVQLQNNNASITASLTVGRTSDSANGRGGSNLDTGLNTH